MRFRHERTEGLRMSVSAVMTKKNVVDLGRNAHCAQEQATHFHNRKTCE